DGRVERPAGELRAREQVDVLVEVRMERPEREDLRVIDLELLILERDDQHVPERQQGEDEEERQWQPQREEPADVVAAWAAIGSKGCGGGDHRQLVRATGWRCAACTTTGRSPTDPKTAACTVTLPRPGRAGRPACRFDRRAWRT